MPGEFHIRHQYLLLIHQMFLRDDSAFLVIFTLFFAVRLLTFFLLWAFPEPAPVLLRQYFAQHSSEQRIHLWVDVIISLLTSVSSRLWRGHFLYWSWQRTDKPGLVRSSFRTLSEPCKNAGALLNVTNALCRAELMVRLWKKFWLGKIFIENFGRQLKEYPITRDWVVAGITTIALSFLCKNKQLKNMPCYLGEVVKPR